MSGNLFEKAVIISSIGLSTLFMGAMYFKKPKVQKNDAFKIRQQLLQQPDVKMLYSTMSFFYLQGFKQKSLQSFFNMHKILSIQNPNFIALPISKQQYDEKYFKVLQHPKFRQSMDKFIHNIQTNNQQAIQNMTDFDLTNLEKLYLIDYCNKIKKCKIVYGRKSKQYYKGLKQSLYRIEQDRIQKNPKEKQKIKQQIDQKITNVKIQNYTQILIQQMKPKVSFSLIPQTPYKVIFGIIQPESLQKSANKWKQKFLQNYSHQVLQDQAVIEREKQLKQTKSKGSIY